MTIYQESSWVIHETYLNISQDAELSMYPPLLRLFIFYHPLQCIAKYSLQLCLDSCAPFPTQPYIFSHLFSFILIFSWLQTVLHYLITPLHNLNPTLQTRRGHTTEQPGFQPPLGSNSSREISRINTYLPFKGFRWQWEVNYLGPTTLKSKYTVLSKLTIMQPC